MRADITDALTSLQLLFDPRSIELVEQLQGSSAPKVASGLEERADNLVKVGVLTNEAGRLHVDADRTSVVIESLQRTLSEVRSVEA